MHLQFISSLIVANKLFSVEQNLITSTKCKTKIIGNFMYFYCLKFSTAVTSSSDQADGCCLNSGTWWVNYVELPCLSCICCHWLEFFSLDLVCTFRRPLFRQSGVVAHEVFTGSKPQFKGHHGANGKVDSNSACDVFVEPVAWMATTILSIEGKVGNI